MKAANLPITIGALSRATQIPVETLRTWERRYLVPTPIRKPSGHRLYPVTAIDHLRQVAQLLDRGHRPAEVLKLSPAELAALLEKGPVPSTASEDPLPDLIRAVSELDRGLLLSQLESQWARRGPLGFLQEVAAPFLTLLGDEWKKGGLEVRHEHFASAALGGFLRRVREPFDARATGPRVVAATPPGEQHEGGLLMASVILSLRGRRLVYLGASTPVAEVAAAARQRRTEAVMISVSKAMKPDRARSYVEELREALPRVTGLWVGGAGAPAAERGVERFESLSALDERLRS